LEKLQECSYTKANRLLPNFEKSRSRLERKCNWNDYDAKLPKPKDPSSKDSIAKNKMEKKEELKKDKKENVLDLDSGSCSKDSEEIQTCGGDSDGKSGKGAGIAGSLKE